MIHTITLDPHAPETRVLAEFDNGLRLVVGQPLPCVEASARPTIDLDEAARLNAPYLLDLAHLEERRQRQHTRHVA